MSKNENSLPNGGNSIAVYPFTILDNQLSATYRLAFSPDGTILASCGWETNFWYEDSEANWTLHHTIPGTLLRINPDQTFLMLFTQDGWFERIELQDSAGICLRTISCRHIKQKYTCKYSLDGKWFLTYDNDGWLYFWDAETLRFETRHLLLPAEIPATRLSLFRFTPDGRQLFFRNGDLICRCQFSTTNPPTILPEGYLFGHPLGHFSPEDFAISPGGDIVAVANGDPYLENRGVDLHRGTSLQHLALFPVGDPFLLDFSSDGKYLACVDYESKVFVWNVSTSQLEQTFVSHPGPIMEQTAAVASIAWSPRGDIIAIEGALEEIQDYSIKLWKVEYL